MFVLQIVCFLSSCACTCGSSSTPVPCTWPKSFVIRRFTMTVTYTGPVACMRRTIYTHMHGRGPTQAAGQDQAAHACMHAYVLQIAMRTPRHPSQRVHGLVTAAVHWHMSRQPAGTALTY